MYCVLGGLSLLRDRILIIVSFIMDLQGKQFSGVGGTCGLVFVLRVCVKVEAGL